MVVLEIVSVTAAVISAVGGAFAAWAAFRSAGSARIAEQAVMDAERRSSLLSIGSTAAEVIIEAERFRDRAKSLKIAYSSLAVVAGQLGGSREGLAHATVDEKLKYAAKLHESVNSFAGGTTALDDLPLVELDRAQLRVTNARTELRAMREDLERDLSSLEAQIAEYRRQQIQR